MDIILSSFCFNTAKTDRHDHKEKNWEGRVCDFYQSMPPVCFRNLGATFEPDYSIFFLGDNFYVDCDTIEKIKSDYLYRKHKELFEALSDVGKLQIVDYSEVIKPYTEIISKSYHNDLKNIVEWKEEFIELIQLWGRFVEYAHSVERKLRSYRYEMSEDITSMDEILNVLSNPMIEGLLNRRIWENLSNWKKRIPKEYREYTLARLAPYLKHVSSNLCLADNLNAVVHDWADITPLYRKKLINSIRPSEIRNLGKQEKCKKLINLMFPDFQPQSMSSFVKALTDKRIETLKEMINVAVRDNIEFDNDFANSTLKEIISKGQQVKRYRNIVGWATLPLSLIPWAGTPLEKGTQLLAEKTIERRIMQSKSWFFLLSEINVPKEKATDNIFIPW